jgi:ribose 5-phosphate isomerase B
MPTSTYATESYSRSRLKSDRLLGLGHTVEDVGSYDPNPVDFPDIARKVAAAITAGKAERGLMVCGTGVGGPRGAHQS